MASNTIVDNRTKADSRYFDTSDFVNVIHACNITIIEHFSEVLFGGDESRVIYASSDYAFRRRVELQSGQNDTRLTRNNLNLPFMNFAVQPGGIKNGGERAWWNHTLNHAGVAIPELEQKIRISPIEISYDSTLFVPQEIDSMFAFSEILWDDSNETILKPRLEIQDQEFVNIGILGYNISYNTSYKEDDWLQQNRIRALDLNMTLQTWMMQTNTEGFGISKKFILDLRQKDSHTGNEYIRKVLEGQIDRENEKTDYPEDFQEYSGDLDDIPG